MDGWEGESQKPFHFSRGALIPQWTCLQSGNEAADSQEAGAAGMASWQGDRAAALAGQAEAASPGTSLEMAGGWPVTSAWMPCEPPKCAPDLVSSLDMAAASSKQGHRRVQRDNAVAATQSLEGTAFLADASTPPCDLFECVIHVLPSHAVSSQAVKLPRHSRQGSHNSRYSGSGDEAAKHWSDGSESCSGTPRPEEAGPVPGHLPLDAVQATAVETPPLAGCDSPRLPSSPVRSSVTRMAELPQGPRATRASGSPVRVSPQTAPNAGGPIKQVSRAKLIAANFEERAAAAEGGQRPSRLKQVSAVALKAQAFERLSAGASGGLRRRGVQSNSKENGFGRPSVDRSHDNAVDSSSSELRKSVSALRPTQLGKAIRTEGQDPLACSSSSLRSSGNRCSITRAAPSPRAAPPKAAEPENKADRIASYPSRFVSGPAAAQYRTHDRLSNKSSHVGLVTVKKPFDKSSAGSAKAAPDASSGLKQPAARRGADGHPLTKLNTNTGGEGKKVLQPWMF